ncbi:S8 family serine peptidase [Arthrobacter sp. H20]|uniref:S8 family serine peptidase n=1 Tax=Arthrobacter sp. H20 TaxID=1267981 RepID=UPI00047D966B|nr:S8 family serine peptidase [Arthrobacter sp. H20]
MTRSAGSLSHRLRVTACLLGVAVATALLPAVPAQADDLREREYWLEDYGITEAWETTQGEGVRVAVIDSGVDGSHPDLEGVVVGGTDVSGSGQPDGQLGIGEVAEHGTLVASLLAGRGHLPDPPPNPSPSDDENSDEESPSAEPVETTGPDSFGRGPEGIVGVAPQSELLAVSVWIEGETKGPNPAGISIDTQIPNAVRWAVDNGAQVINMSLGSTSPTWPESWDEAFLYAEQNDVVIVAAAGNRAGGSLQVGAPATMPGVLAVAGLDREGEASRESSSEGISIGVAAPAENLVGALPGGVYADWSGSSGAAPLVAGTAALIRSKYPDLSAAQVINRILMTARDAGAEGVERDTLYGYGILDVAAAVDSDLAVPDENLLGSMAEFIEIYRRGAPAPPPEPASPTSEPPVVDIPEPEVPVADEGSATTGGLPAAIVVGFAALIVVILAGGTVAVIRARRSALSRPVDESTDTDSLAKTPDPPA